MKLTTIVLLAKIGGWLIVAGGTGMLVFFMLGTFKSRTINSLHERLSASYGVITIGLLVLALTDLIAGKGSKAVASTFKYVATHQFVIYLLLAVIIFAFALIEWRRSLKNYANEEN